MARKKKLTLEQEFEERKAEHKATIILYTLLKFPDTIYDSRYFKCYKDMEVEPIENCERKYSEPEIRAIMVEEDIDCRAQNGEAGLYDKVYKFCWKKVNKFLEENVIL